MKYNEVKQPKCRMNTKVNQFSLLTLFFALFLTTELTAQQKLKTNFTLDTTQTQIYPFDLDFSLNLIDSKKSLIKRVYLVRLNNKGKVVFDPQTSLYQIGQIPNSKNLIINRLNGRIFKSEQHLEVNTDSLNFWEEHKKKKEQQLIKEKNIVKIERLKSEVKIYKMKIEKYLANQRFLDSLKNNSKEYINRVKRELQFFPLEIESREKDTLTVKIPPLKPNKNYLILAVNESKKINKLKKLVEDYLKCGVIEKKEVIVIPVKYLPNDSERPVKLKFDSKNDNNSKKEEKSEGEIKFTIPASTFEDEFKKAKDKKIGSLIAVNKQKLELKGFENFKNFPGPFKYPISSVERRFNHDSVFTYVPDDFNKDFRLVNSVLSEFKNYGDSLIIGKYKLEEDKEKMLKINFKPKTDLDNQLSNISNHLNIATKAQKSLFLLAEAENDNFEDYNKYFSNIIDILSINRDTLAKRVEAKTKVNNLLAGMNIPYGLQTNALEKGTFSYQFLTRNSGIIKQSAGFLYYSSGKQGFSGVAPFTGVDILIRPTNENTKFWKIKGWEKFLSFQIGVPIFANELTEGERRKHLVGDTFSLFTGLGFNLGHSIKLSYGAILFRSLDGNLIGERTYKINSAHAVSIGINFKLLPLVKNILGSDKAINLVK